MAANMKTNGALQRKKLHWPSQMGGRTTEIRAVGAWVQSEPYDYNYDQDAVISAQMEERRMKQIQLQKDQKLQSFQKEVSRRVQDLQKLKRQQQLEKSYKAVEAERNVVRQSAFAAEKSTPRKNRCTHRQNEDLSIKHTSSQIGPIADSSENTISTITADDDSTVFDDAKQRVHKVTSHARRKLGSRQVVTENFLPDDLPGGLWREGATRDYPAARNTLQPDIIELDEESDTTDTIRSDEFALEELQNKMVQFDKELSKEKRRLLKSGRKSSATSSQTGSSSSSINAVPNIYPGVMSEEERVQTQNQRAMYRRLFMDIEREQVKENIRRQQHKKNINTLKKKAEEERKAIENQARSILEPKDPITGETPTESFEREMVERELLERTQIEQKLKSQKNREMGRFLEALKINLREKIKNQNIQLPPMCCCGDSVWDTNPDTCANNCVFYRNPKAYAQALQSLLASCDVA